MPFDAIYVPSALIMPGPATITQFEDFNPTENFTDVSERAPGAVGPSHGGHLSAKPEVPFGSTQLADLLALLAAAGNYVIKDLSAGNTDIEYRKKVSIGTRDAIASTTHIRSRAALAALVFDGVSGRKDELCRGRFRLLKYTTDGQTDPDVWTSGVAITATPTIDELFTFGKLTLNGSQINGIEEFDWNNNLNVVHEVSGGDKYPSYSRVDDMRPELVVKARSTALHSTYRSGVALTSCVLSLRKVSPSSFTIATGTTVHIVFTATAGVIKSREIQGENANVELLIQIVDATGVWFTINTASAIA